MTEKYASYLKSNHWKCIRMAAINRWGDRCANCSIPKVDVHHLAYRNLYDVTVEDLMPLCRRCHENVHASVRLSRLIRDNNTDVGQKRIMVLSYLAGLDEAITQKVIRQNRKEIAEELRQLQLRKSQENKLRETHEKREAAAKIRTTNQKIRKDRERKDDETIRSLFEQPVPIDFIELTEDAIKALRTEKNGLTAATLAALGLNNKSLPRKWSKKIIGLKISKTSWTQAILGKAVFVPKRKIDLTSPSSSAS